ASPAFVIPKTDGSVQLVYDFRKVNTNFERQYLDGIQPMKSRLKPSRGLQPSQPTELRRFVGMRWRRRAHRLAPLTRLTSPKVTFKWAAVEQAAFKKSNKH
ncbi:TPA: hypothetical protein N0F65_011769, partial [Lagenidium giganteum]